MNRPDDEIDIEWGTDSIVPANSAGASRTIPAGEMRTVPVPPPTNGPVISMPDELGDLPPQEAIAISLPPDELLSVPPEPAASEPDLTPVEDTCGRYRLCFELAAGGMATVFLARHEGNAGFEKLVALKRIHPHLQREDQFVEMFLDEARVASRITHPNVCGVTDFGCVNGQYYLAMEYLFGEPISRVRARLSADARLRTRSLRYVLRMIADAAEGLHAAHELRDDDGNLLNVVHRDVAPQNLFVGYDGNTKVVDFGIAKARGRLTSTATGVLKGHLAYMAPEQFTSKDVDRRTDVWALGVVLWELVAGARLFQTSTDIASTVMAVLAGPIAELSVVRPELPPGLDDIVTRCLSRSPTDRYATAREMGKELNAFLHRYCEPTGIAEVSEWLESLFAKERAAKERLVLEARRAHRL